MSPETGSSARRAKATVDATTGVTNQTSATLGIHSEKTESRNHTMLQNLYPAKFALHGSMFRLRALAIAVLLAFSAGCFTPNPPRQVQDLGGEHVSFEFGRRAAARASLYDSIYRR